MMATTSSRASPPDGANSTTGMVAQARPRAKAKPAEIRQPQRTVRAEAVSPWVRQ
ncbi:hypothetical protein ACU4GA_10015 [Methylobacterium oryzae CBMB20]